MAIINTYPTATPKGADLLIGTQVKDDTVEENSTKSFSVDALGSYIVTSTSGITGSGTLNTIAMFTPNGQSVGDSVITQTASGSGVSVDSSLIVEDDLTVQGAVEANNTLTVEGISTLRGNVLVNGSYLEIQAAIKDSSSNLPSSAGQILVGDAAGDVTWTDSTNIVSGAVAKLIPYTTTATPGGSETYTALNNIVKIGWSGGNGIYVINLPSATAIPYRVIRFVTNGTYPGGGAHKVRFTATGGETIDGAAFFETSKVYEGIAVWSTGTEWVIIQAKAH
jgi:hypothetical protein